MIGTSVSFVKKEAALSQGAIPYAVGGQGHPVLYLHSAGGPRITEALEKLAESYQIYAPVFPGFDGTPTLENVKEMKDLAHLSAEFIRTVIGGKCDVIGHSFGGWVSSWLAVLYPDLVAQLILETPAGFRPEGKGGLDFGPEELMRRMYVYPERLSRYAKPLDIQQRNRQMVECYGAGIAMDQELADRLPELQSLTLILAGTKDGVIPEESGRLLKNKIPRSYLCYIYNAAHNPEIDQPERFVRVVRDFMQRGEAFLIKQSEVST